MEYVLFWPLLAVMQLLVAVEGSRWLLEVVLRAADKGQRPQERPTPSR